MGVKAKEWKGAWWVFVNHGGRRKAKRCASKRAAEAARDAIDAKLKLGQFDGIWETPEAPAPVPTFAEYAERWLTSVAALRTKPSTVEEYRMRLRLRLLPSLGPLRLDYISRETVRGLMGDLVRRGNLRKTKQANGAPAVVARATVLEALRTLSAIFTTAEEDGVIPSNPVRRIGRHLVETTASEAYEIEVFSREELTALLDVTAREFEHHHAFILCLARTGMRLGEALALEWRDIDWKNRLVLVRRSRRRGRVSEPKNGKARRVD